jgi:hypothetical protein
VEPNLWLDFGSWGAALLATRPRQQTGDIDLENAIHDRLYETEQQWHQQSVSWVQLILTLGVTIIMGVIGGVVYLGGWDKRLTIVEERQETVRMDKLPRLIAEVETLKGQVLSVPGRLDVIQTQLSTLQSELGKHEAATNKK